MSLIKCKDCGNEMSSEAKACPKCGAPPPKRTSPFSVVLAILVTIGVVQCVARETATTVKEPVATAAPVSQPTFTTLQLYSKIVPSLVIDGKRIVPGITQDDFLSRFGFQRTSQEVAPDPGLPGSLVILARHHEAKQDFVLEWRRERDPGPYKLSAIRIP